MYAFVGYFNSPYKGAPDQPFALRRRPTEVDFRGDRGQHPGGDAAAAAAQAALLPGGGGSQQLGRGLVAPGLPQLPVVLAGPAVARAP